MCVSRTWLKSGIGKNARQDPKNDHNQLLLCEEEEANEHIRLCSKCSMTYHPMLLLSDEM